MKKKIISLILILTILLTGCGSSKETTKETTVNDLVNSNIITEFEKCNIYYIHRENFFSKSFIGGVVNRSTFLL